LSPASNNERIFSKIRDKLAMAEIIRGQGEAEDMAWGAGGVGPSISLGLRFTPALYRLITFSFSVAPTRTSAGSWDWRGAVRD
jgi:hypothetical protein